MAINPMLSFRAERATVHLGMTHEGAKQRSVVLALKLDAGEDVETAEKRSLRTVEWSISLYEGSEFNAHAKEQQAIGFLSHHPESKSDYDYSAESCCASAAIEPVTFTALWSLVASGRLPDWLSISVKDMTYGYDPDGREKIWDVLNNRSVAITEVLLRFPVATTPVLSTEPDSDSDAVQANVPATSADVQASAAHVTKSIADLQTSLVAHLRYIVAIVAFIAIYVLFK